MSPRSLAALAAALLLATGLAPSPASAAAARQAADDPCFVDDGDFGYDDPAAYDDAASYDDPASYDDASGFGDDPYLDDEDPGAGDECAMESAVVLPDLTDAFLARTWDVEADVDGFEDGVLSVSGIAFRHVKRKFRDEAAAVEEFDSADVTLARGAKVFDKKGRRVRKARKVARLLDRADAVTVTGQVLPTDEWDADLGIVAISADEVSIED